jgi:ABC-type antimicrobial peptide transport system permease subunit
MNVDTTTSDLQQSKPCFDCWREWAGVSLGVHLLTFITYTMAICGCHFHGIAAIFGAPPLIMAGLMPFFWKAKGERVIGYLNIALGVAWLLLEWESNLQFLFR